ncbi:MAG: phosphopantothenoylcysteine decarboxylase, partial [Muribaculaceae bacterium]|nr:phosphopantothenoylcysteine decarboxylase [Muribaculaceae bacterium]
GIKRIDVVSARQMLEASLSTFEDSDYAIMAAAVADYAPAETSDVKIKREGIEELCIRLRRNPDIAATLGSRKGNRILVGFALETDNCLENARRKMANKGFDMIVLNDATKPGAGFMCDTNIVSIVDANGVVTEYPCKSKRAVAHDIVDSMLAYSKL